jgi:hypothetical protein
MSDLGFKDLKLKIQYLVSPSGNGVFVSLSSGDKTVSDL